MAAPPGSRCNFATMTLRSAEKLVLNSFNRTIKKMVAARNVEPLLFLLPFEATSFRVLRFGFCSWA